MRGAMVDTIWQLFKDGPTRDGNLVSKSARDDAVLAGMVDRSDGWTWLILPGVQMAIDMQFGRKKDALK